MDSTKIVGEKIKSLRETKEISVAELAVRSGLAEEQIERIENNVDPSFIGSPHQDSPRVRGTSGHFSGRPGRTRSSNLPETRE